MISCMAAILDLPRFTQQADSWVWNSFFVFTSPEAIGDKIFKGIQLISIINETVIFTLIVLSVKHYTERVHQNVHKVQGNIFKLHFMSKQQWKAPNYWPFNGTYKTKSCTNLTSDNWSQNIRLFLESNFHNKPIIKIFVTDLLLNQLTPTQNGSKDTGDVGDIWNRKSIKASTHILMCTGCHSSRQDNFQGSWTNYTTRKSNADNRKSGLRMGTWMQHVSKHPWSSSYITTATLFTPSQTLMPAWLREKKYFRRLITENQSDYTLIKFYEGPLNNCIDGEQCKSVCRLSDYSLLSLIWVKK